MRIIFFFILLTIQLGCFAHRDTVELKKVVDALDKALLAKDISVLVKLLHPKATYGHSNGWVETTDEVIKDIRTGYLVYEKLETTNTSFVVEKDWATVRMRVAVKGMVKDTPFEMQLYVLQVWKRMKSGWQLVARQSAKVDK